MRILHVTHELPPYEAAGTGIYTLNIARAQARHHDVFVFSRFQDPKAPPFRTHTERRDGLTIRFVNRAELDWSPFEKSYLDPKIEKIFVRFLDETRPEIVHFEHVFGLGTGLIDRVRERGIKAVFTLHDFWTMCPRGQRMCYTDNQLCDPIDFGKCGPCVFGDGWKQLGARETAFLANSGSGLPPHGLLATWRHHYARRYHETPGLFARRPRAMLRAALGTAINAFTTRPATDRPATTNPFELRFHLLREKLMTVDLLLAPSIFLRDEFMKHFRIPAAKIIHSSYGMDFAYVTQIPKTPSAKLRFGYLGSIIQTKGVHVLVDAFLEAAATCDNVELHVHGAPNHWTNGYCEDLKNRVAAHPAGPRAHFHGRFDNSRIGEILSEIDVLVVPSIWFENAPLVLHEAAMTRTPVVTSDRGGMLEFVTTHRYGRTFALGNPKSLAAVMRDLASDASKLQTLAGDPPSIKSVVANADELVAIYRSLL